MGCRVCALAAVAWLSLAGCGGGGAGKSDLGSDGPPSADTDVPDVPDVPIQPDIPEGPKDGETIAPDQPDGQDDPGNPDVPGGEETVDEEVLEDAEVAETGEESPFYPAPELFLKILGPNSDHHAASAGSLISVTGVLFGEAETITWTSPKGQGEIVPSHFWLSDAIELSPGDNMITVTAKGKDGAISDDNIMVVYSPGFMFTELPEARPDVVFVGEPQQVVFTIRLGQSEAMQKDTVALYATNPDLSAGNKLKDMKDDGNVGSSGDEITNDGVFTARTQVSCSTDGRTAFRVGLMVKTGVSTYTAYSPPVLVECATHVSQADCQTALQTQKSAKTLYDTKVKDVGEAAARVAVVEYFKNNAAVKEAGMEQGGFGVWTLYKSGLLGALSLAPAGVRAGGEDEAGLGTIESAVLGPDEIASKRAMVMSPYAAEFGADDETQTIGMSMKSKACPTYDLSGPHLGPQATLMRMRDGMKAGVFAIATHGDTLFGGMNTATKNGFGWSHDGSQEVLFAGEPVGCSALLAGTKGCSDPAGCPAGTECVITAAQGTSLSGVCVDRTQTDLRRGRVAIGSDNYAVLPAFFERYGHSGMPDSLVYAGACRGARIGTLAAAFLGSGAKAFLGFDGYVTNKFAGKKGMDFFKAIVDEGKLTGQAFPQDIEDPDNKGSKFVLIGAHSLTVTNSNIINEGFERGDLTGWTADGDGRVITKLGATKPVAGKFMGIISSGLGYTTQTGTVEQTFCIPNDIYGFTFYWKFYSEEFHEWCGSQFQDTFTARFINALGQEIQVVNVAIDDLCDPDDCGGCCGAGKCVGLIPSDVQFDQGDAHMVPKWQKAKVDITQFAGKGPVTLSFFCTDKGDSIYDTVILFDALKFK